MYLIFEVTPTNGCPLRCIGIEVASDSDMAIRTFCERNKLSYIDAWKYLRAVKCNKKYASIYNTEASIN